MKLNLQNIDKTFWILFGLLIVVAIIALFSASATLVYAKHSALGPIGSQMFFILIGVIVAFGLQYVPTPWIRFFSYGLLGLSVLMLYSMFIPHNPFVAEINGAARWFKIFGFQFMPSELAKLALIVVVADQLARIRTEDDKRKYFYRTLIITGITVLPIFPENLSTTILMCGIVWLLWILARIPFKYVGSVVAIALAAMIVGYSIVEFGFIRTGKAKALEGTVMERAITWVGRIDRHFVANEGTTSKYELNADKTNIQEVYSAVAIARGGASPIGVLPGNSKERDYLPLAFADYIFAIIVEESGIVGAAFLIFIYLAILFRACNISSRYSDMPAMLMTMGLALMITCQALISMLVAVGLGPVTGQPLPLISRGGTSVLITSIYFGIMMGVSREQLALRSRVQETIDDSREEVPELTFDNDPLTP